MQKTVFGFAALFSGICVVLLFYGFYNDYWSPEAKLGFQNQKNIHRVKLGMTVQEVARVMGKPAFVSQTKTWPQKTQHTYQVPPGSSKHCDIEFDRSGKVVYTYCSPE